MYNPCANCEYQRICSSDICEVKKNKDLLEQLRSYMAIDDIIKVLKGDSVPISLLTKDKIDYTYTVVMAAKDGII